MKTSKGTPVASSLFIACLCGSPLAYADTVNLSGNGDVKVVASYDDVVVNGGELVEAKLVAGTACDGAGKIFNDGGNWKLTYSLGYKRLEVFEFMDLQAHNVTTAARIRLGEDAAKEAGAGLVQLDLYAC